MSWSPLQREILDAMGLMPMQLLASAPSGVIADSSAAASSAASPGLAGAAQPGRSPQSPGRAADVAPAGLDAMTRALLRAAGAPQARDAVLALCPAPQALRGDPRAKRALWPRLRALRRR
jgi:hypothetical protein